MSSLKSQEKPAASSAAAGAPASINATSQLPESLHQFEDLYRMYLKDSITAPQANGLPSNAHFSGEHVVGLYRNLVETYGSRLPDLFPLPSTFDSMEERAIRIYIFCRAFLDKGRIVGLDSTAQHHTAKHMLRQIMAAKNAWFTSILTATGPPPSLKVNRYERSEQENILDEASSCKDRSYLFCGYHTKGDQLEGSVHPTNRCERVVTTHGPQCRVSLVYLTRLRQTLRDYAFDTTQTRPFPIVPIKSLYEDVYNMWWDDRGKQSSDKFVTLPPHNNDRPLPHNWMTLLIYLYSDTRDTYQLFDLYRSQVQPGFTKAEIQEVGNIIATSGTTKEQLRGALRSLIKLVENRVGRIAWIGFDRNSWLPMLNNLVVHDRRNSHADAAIEKENSLAGAK